MADKPKTESLMRSQKNGVYKHVQESGLFPSDFRWDTVRSRLEENTKVERIIHVSSGYYFVFDRYRSVRKGIKYWDIRYSPTSESNDEKVMMLVPSWSGVSSHLDDWLSYVKREMDEPDLWTGEEQQEFKSDWQESDDHFTLEELKHLQYGLDRVEKLLIEQSSGTPEVVDDIRENVQYLKEAAKTSSKRDWMMMFVGVVVSHYAEWALTNIHWHQLVSVLLEGAKKVLPIGG